jgi:PAS domain S-box-containing protein
MPPAQALAMSETTLAARAIEPAGEALHLRRLIEQQPACLLRVGVDGLLLAVNEAGLRLLGAESLPQVLGSNLKKIIMPRHHEEWQEFAARVRSGASGSIECDLTDLSGTSRTVLLQGVPLLDHADGVPSMILTARDLSAPRRLEAAIVEREVSRELDDLQKELKQGLSADGAIERMRRTLTDEHQAALLFKEQEAQQALHSVRSELEQARAEQQRLTTLLDDREIGHQRVVAAHAVEKAGLRQTLAEEHQLALLLTEREGRQLRDGLRMELERALGEQQRLRSLLDDSEIGHQRVVAALAAEQAKLHQTLADEHQLALLVKEREGRQLLDNLRTELEQALADRPRFAAAVARQSEIEQALAAAIGKQRAIEKALEDQRMERQIVEDNARNLEWLAAAGRVGLSIGSELLTIVAAVDARTQHLLVESSLGAENRHVIEALRGDAIEAASLARQLLQIHSEPPGTIESPNAGTVDVRAPGHAERKR